MNGSSRKSKNYIVDLVFTLALFGAFAVSAIMVVYFGVKVYESINASMDRNFTSRTAVAYITEKLRQRDSEGTADIVVLDGKNAIALVKKTDDDIESTYIFSDEGYLKEITVRGEEVPEVSEGVKVMELASFAVKEVAEGVYNVVIIDTAGNTERAYISTKCDPRMRGEASAAPVE